MRNTMDKKSGVTLVALVVTVIVLLILAGVTIAALTGDNGIINKAHEAVAATELSQIKEEVLMKWYEIENEHLKDYLPNEELAGLLEEELQKVDPDATVKYSSANDTLEVFYKGYEIELQADGQISNNRATAKNNISDAYNKAKNSSSDKQAQAAKIQEELRKTDPNATATYNSSTGNIDIEYNGYKESVNDEGEVVISEPVETAKLTITSQPKIVETYEKEEVNFEVEVNSNGELTYQWYKNTRNVAAGATAIEGATSNKYTIPSVSLDDNATYYYCEITTSLNNTTKTARTNIVKLTVLMTEETKAENSVTDAWAAIMNDDTLSPQDKAAKLQEELRKTDPNATVTYNEETGDFEVKYNDHEQIIDSEGNSKSVESKTEAENNITDAWAEIKDDDTLTPEQKAAKLEEILKETDPDATVTYDPMTGDMTVKYNGYEETIDDAGTVKSAASKKIAEEEITKAWEGIKDDNTLTPEQKAAALQAALREKDETATVTYDPKTGKYEITYKGYNETIDSEGNAKSSESQTIAETNITEAWAEIKDQNLTPEQKAAALQEALQATDPKAKVNYNELTGEYEVYYNGYNQIIDDTGTSKSEDAKKIAEEEITSAWTEIKGDNTKTPEQKAAALQAALREKDETATVTYDPETGKYEITYKGYNETIDGEGNAKSSESQTIAETNITEAWAEIKDQNLTPEQKAAALQEALQATDPKAKVNYNELTGEYEVTYNGYNQIIDDTGTSKSEDAKKIAEEEITSAWAEIKGDNTKTPEQKAAALQAALREKDETATVTYDPATGKYEITYKGYKETIDSEGNAKSSESQTIAEKNITSAWAEIKDQDLTPEQKAAALQEALQATDPAAKVNYNELTGEYEVYYNGYNQIIDDTGTSKSEDAKKIAEEEITKAWGSIKNDDTKTPEEKAAALQEALQETDSNATVTYNPETDTIEISYKGYEETVDSNGTAKPLESKTIAKNKITEEWAEIKDDNTKTPAQKAAALQEVLQETDSNATVTYNSENQTMEVTYNGYTETISREDIIKTPTITVDPSTKSGNVDYNATNTFTVTPTSTPAVNGTWEVSSNRTEYVSIEEGNNQTATDSQATTIKYKGLKATTEETTITITFTPSDNAAEGGNYDAVSETYTVTAVNKIQATAPTLGSTSFEYTEGTYRTITTTYEPLDSEGTLYYRVSTDNGSTYGEWKTESEWAATNGNGGLTSPAITDYGSIKVQAYVAGDDNHTDSNIAPSETTGAECKITSATLTIEHSGNTETYDGKAHTINLDVKETTTGNVVWSSDSNKEDNNITYVNEGYVDVYYSKTTELTEDNYVAAGTKWESNTDAAIANVSETTTIYWIIIPTTSNYDKESGSDQVIINAKSVEATWTDQEDYTYKLDEEENPVAQGPTPSVASGIEGETISLTLSYKVSSAEDSTYTATKPTNAGTYIAKISDWSVNDGEINKGNYEISNATHQYTILRNPTADAATVYSQNPTYTGSLITGLFGNYITWDGEISGTNVNTYTAYATPIANYEWSPEIIEKYDLTSETETIELEWAIVEKSLSAATVSAELDETSYTYDGATKSPEITVTDSARGVELTAGTDYTVSYENSTTNTDDKVTAGTITVTITGAGNYKDSIEKQYVISKADATMTLSSNTATKYTGVTVDVASYVSNAKGTPTYEITTNGTGNSPSYGTSSINGSEVTLGAMSETSDEDQTVAVTVTDPGTANFEGTTATFTITVQKYTRTLSWNETTPTSVTYGDTSKSATVQVSDTGGTQGTVTYSSETTSAITINETTGAISVVSGSSSSKITASLSRTSTVKAASIDITISTAKAAATMSLTSNTATKYTGETVDISPFVSNSKGTPTYEITTNGTGNSPSYGTSSISGSEVTLGTMSETNDADETVIVTVTDPGTANFEGTTATYTITVQKYTRTLSWNATTPTSVTYLDTSKYATVSTTGSGGTAGDISYSNGGSSNLTINSSTGGLTPISYSEGVTITATMARTSTVKQATETTTIAVARANGYVSLNPTSGNISYGTASKTFDVTGSHGGTLSISDNNETATSDLAADTGTPTATISNLGSIAAGTTITVTVTSAQTSQYNEAEATYTLTIGTASATMSLSSTSATKYTGTKLDISTYVQNAKGTPTYEITTNGTTTASTISGSEVTLGAMSTANDDDQTVTVTVTDPGNNNYEGTSEDFTITVQKYTRTLSWATGTPTSVTYGDTSKSATVQVSGTGGTAGSVTYTSETTSAITINSSTGAITVVAAGSSSKITASLARTATVKAASENTTISTTKAAATFSLSSTSATKYTGEKVDVSSYVQNAKGTPTYEITTNGTGNSPSYGTSSINGSEVTLGTMSTSGDGNQTVIVTVTDPGNNNYEGTSATYTITVQKYTRTLSWDATTPTSVTYGDTSKSATVQVSGTGGTAGSVSYTSETTSAITIDSLAGTITVVAAGSSSKITASLSRTATVKAASTDTTISTTKADATMSLSSTSATKYTGEKVDVSSYVQNAKGTPTYEITTNGTGNSPSFGTSSIIGSEVTLGTMSESSDSNQTVAVKVTDPGNSNYEGTNATLTITVQKYTRTLEWTNTTPSSVTYLDTSKYATVSASGSGGTAGAISYSNGGSSNLTINSSTGQLTPVSYSTGVTITATMARTSTVKQATKTTSIAVARATGYINISETSGSVTYGTASKTFNVTGSHGGTLSISDNNATATCKLSATTGTPTATIETLGSIAAGTTITVTVKSAQTTQYNEAEATYTLTIGTASATMTLSSNTATKYTGTTLDISSYVQNAKGTPTYAIKDKNSASANEATKNSTISGSTVTMGALSTANDNDQNVAITVTDPGDGNYEGTSKEFTITIQKYTRSLSWKSGTPSSVAYGDSSKSATVEVSGTGGTAGSISYSSETTSAITIDSLAGTITVVAAGSSSKITASLSRTATVKANSTNTTISTTKASATMTLSSNTATQKTGTTINIANYVQNAKGTPTYEIKNKTNASANEATKNSTISSSTVTLGAMSTANDDDQTVVITVTDPGNGNYTGTSKEFTVTVQKYTRTLSWKDTTPTSVAYGDTSKSATVNVTGSGGTAGSVSYSSGTTAAITINSTSGAITVVAGSNSSKITASLARTATVKANSIETTITTTRQTVNAPTNVAVSTAGRVTWTASSNATSYQISIDNTNWTSNVTSGVDFLSTIIGATGERTVYVRAVNSNSTNYSTPSSNATKKVTVYGLTFGSNDTSMGTVNTTSYNVISGATSSVSSNVLTITGVTTGTTTTTLKTVTATATDGNKFSSWSGNSTPITGAQAIKANFETDATPLNTQLTAASGAQYYGDPINYNVDISDSTSGHINGWKIFYANSSGTYIIAADYVNTSKLSTVQTKATSSVVKLTSPYIFYWGTPSHTTFDSAQKTRFMYNSTIGTGNYNVKACSDLLNADYWSGFVNKDQGATYAVGAPTLEMYTASWNAKGYTKLYYAEKANTGYYVGTSANPTSYNVNPTNSTTLNDKLYYPHGNSSGNAWNSCYGYWLASPSANGTGLVMYVSYDGYVSGNRYDSTGYGVRPVVFLPSSVNAERNASGTWEIK